MHLTGLSIVCSAALAAGYRRITIEFFDFGIEINVKPPRRAEVMSYDEFERLAARN